MVSPTRPLRIALVAAWLLASMLRLAHAQEAVFETYQDRAGLTNMTVRCLSQEANGVLWIGTENGLFRFDGFRVHREQLPADAGNTIGNVHADRFGRLWAATGNGLYLRRESAAGPAWVAVTMADGRGLRVAGGQSLDVDERGVLFVMEWDNKLVTVNVPAGAPQRVVGQPVQMPGFTPFEGTPDASSGPVRSLADALWFGCGSGLCRWKDGQLESWGPSQGLPSAAWSTLLVTHDGSLWARSSTGLARLVPRGKRFEAIVAPAEYRWAGTIALAEDPRGAIVTATDAGVARWDGQRWQAWTPHEGLPETAVRALLFDARGSLWLGTSGRGLHRWIGYGEVDHWTPASGLPSPVVAAVARANHGRLWAGTAEGIASFDPVERRFQPVPVASAAGHMVRGLAVDSSDDLWWIEGDQLLVLRAAGKSPQVVLSDPSLSYVVQGPHAVYVVGTRGAQRIVTSRAGAQLEPLPGALPDADILRAVITDGVNDWFLAGRHVYRFDGGAWTPMRDGRGVPVEALGAAVFAGDSEMWVADKGGISAYEVRAAVARPATRLPRSSFGDGAVYFIRVDAVHRLWIGTDRGLFIRDQGHWSHLDRASGLLWNDISEDAIIFDPDGTAWVGTSAGITEILPGMRSAPVATLRLDGVQFGERRTSAAPVDPIAWADRSIRVTVGSSGAGRGGPPSVEYRLHDDEPWQSIDGNVVQLESLQPDSYALQMRAAARFPLDEPGLVLRVAFEVGPPWWSGTPAKCGYAAAVAGLWYLSVFAIRRRATATRRRLEKAIADRTVDLERSRKSLRELGEHNARSLESERKRVSRELHDEMGQQLAALRMEVSVMRMRANAAQPLGVEHLDTLLERVDSLVASVRTLVSQLRPPALDGGLMVAIEWLAAELRRGADVQCDLELDGAARDLPAEAATMIFRIVQESFANVRRHARARHVEVSLRPHEGRWVLEVRDDGAGFDSRSSRTGFGLLGMAERARALGGELSIRSEPGQGTTIRVEIDARPRET